MAENRTLELAIAEAAEFEPGRYPGGLAVAFFRLMDVPQDKTPDRWAELRRALRNNPHLEDPDVQAFLSRPDLAARGYWWFDPERW
ncbi:hypothetical protein GQ464_005575 [Rhodocaloribacter litoris]|uniref:hypothetical protein n=1 Tax=Rhodocaloribacter litoris TaxID=2558931 RepID=UPI00141DB82E|nr:hypothetical protein [Rhodocaloribacter litoris]QXD16419.1 hypothetical protein GQ464_005575 [Rhodocaloribacter litoris]